jgi:hypothetical protein
MGIRIRRPKRIEGTVPFLIASYAVLRETPRQAAASATVSVRRLMIASSTQSKLSGSLLVLQNRRKMHTEMWTLEASRSELLDRCGSAVSFRLMAWRARVVQWAGEALSGYEHEVMSCLSRKGTLQGWA